MTAEKTTATGKVKDVGAWKAKGVHDITLATGAEVTIKIPNLPAMVKAGAIPNDLLDAALGSIQQQEITPELIKEQSDFFDLLVSTMLVEPSVSPEDVIDLPYEDVELLVEIGTRQRDLDALGHHISGLHKSEDWRKFRGWDHGD